MKKQVKRFGQFVNEARRFGEGYGIDRDPKSTDLSIIDLLDCWVETNQPTGMVLVMIDISNPGRDLIDRGIEVVVNPSDKEIGVAQYDGTYHAELYKDGQRIGEEDYFSEDEEY
jgi:hypothetical protein